MKIKKTKLKQNGDFRSSESIDVLKEVDIVVTNPPFSLFREFIDLMFEYDKKFIIIGNQNAITYKNVFKYIKDNKLWLGVNKPKDFSIPSIATGKVYGYDSFGNPIIRLGFCVWFTNLRHKKRNEELILCKEYYEHEDEYPQYDNYDAINVDKVRDIPVDYIGTIGVPITFLGKYNPAQFEIIGLGISNSGQEIGVGPYKESHRKYRKEIQKRGAVDGDLYMVIDKVVKVPYARILIKRKK